MPYFLVWSLCIKRLVHHAVYCIILVLSLYSPFYAIPIYTIVCGINIIIMIFLTIMGVIKDMTDATSQGEVIL